MKRFLSILLSMSLLAGLLVTGASAEESIRVKLGEIPVYSGGYNYHNIPVTVTAGDQVLVKDQDYTLTYKNNQKPTYDATVTVKGQGTYAGYEETFTYPILRRNVADLDIQVSDVYFEGDYVKPTVTVSYKGYPLTKGTDYVVTYENNVNAGTGTVRVIGKDRYYGCAERQFRILTGPREVTLKGNYLGNADGTLSEDYAYSEMILSPGKLTAKVDCAVLHIAAYALYRIEGEEAVLVTEYTSKDSTSSTDTAFTYDFSSIYEGIEESSGEVYVLSYSWMNYLGNVYGGAALLGIPSKVGPATSMTLTEQEGLGNFRNRYVAATGVDGVLGDVSWSSSDSSIATVERGIVTFKKPGKVTITARSGDLVETIDVTGNTQMLTAISLYDYSPEKGVTVLSNYRIMEEGTDYTLSVEQKDGQNIVTVTGCGLFIGQLVRSFDIVTGDGADHTHVYRNSCDTACSGCDEIRTGGHSYSNDWLKDTTHHWHTCETCGYEGDKAEHTLAAGDSSTCTTCGKLYLPGDFNGDWLVTDADVIWLLWYTVFPEDYPLVSSGDFNGDSLVTDADVIYLLWHTVFPEDYPLN